MLTTTRRNGKSQIKLTPEHDGQRMSLKAFEPAFTPEGWRFELARGIVIVSDVPDIPHMDQVWVFQQSLFTYHGRASGRIHRILGPGEYKLLLWDMESERRPDIAVYLTPPPPIRGSLVWSTWIPAIVIEVVSLGSKDRDYVEKREEYWALGVKEYWIADARRGQILVLRRGKSRWIETRLTRDDLLTTKLLPGFQIECREVFDAAAQGELS